MTEELLDKLRKHAERLSDEANRFQRSLKGSSANREQAIEHLTNVAQCVDRCWADGLLPVVTWPVVTSAVTVTYGDGSPAGTFEVATQPLSPETRTATVGPKKHAKRGK